MRKFTAVGVLKNSATLLRSRRFIVIAACVLVLVGALVYEVVLPNKFASNYQKSMEANTQKLRTAFWATAETQSLPVFNNADATPDKNLSDLAKAETATSKNKEALETYEASAKELKKLPFSGYTSNYKAAKKTEAKAQQTVTTARQDIDSYQGLLAYLTAMNKAGKKVVDGVNLDKLSSDSDLATLTADVKQDADILHTYAQEINAIKPPSDEAASYSAPIKKSTGELADALDSLVVALQNEDISAAESAMQKLTDLTNQQPDTSKTAIPSMKVVQNIVNLPKLAEQD